MRDAGGGLQSINASLLASTCLSASNFVGATWKKAIISIAELVSPRSGSPVLLARYQLRVHQLSRLYFTSLNPGCRQRFDQLWEVSTRDSPYYGLLALFKAQEAIDRMAKTSTIESILQAMGPLTVTSHHGYPQRTLQSLLRLEGLTLVARCLRFEGRFDEAADRIKSIMSAAHCIAYSTKRLTAELCAVECERRNVDKSIRLIRSEYLNLAPAQVENGDGRRLRLALANSHLMKGLLTWYGEDKANTEDLTTAAELFSSLGSGCPVSLVGKYMKYVALSGRGMATLFLEDYGTAITTLNHALEAAQVCWPDPGHAEMIVLYALSEACHQTNAPNAIDFGLRSRRIFQKVGRQHHWVGQGTIWLDVLDRMAENAGRKRFTSPFFHQYWTGSGRAVLAAGSMTANARS